MWVKVGAGGIKKALVLCIKHQAQIINIDPINPKELSEIVCTLHYNTACVRLFSETEVLRRTSAIIYFVGTVNIPSVMGVSERIYKIS